MNHLLRVPVNRYLLMLLISLILVACSKTDLDADPDSETEESNIATDVTDGPLIHGLSIIPPDEVPEGDMLGPIVAVNANWITIIPYAYGSNTNPSITYPRRDQRWMETEEGIIATVQEAHDRGLKVMLKPSVYVPGHGWAGDAQMEDEEEWLEWEENYRSFILLMADLAESLEVELLSIGTEYDDAVTARPDFWNALPDLVRQHYSGKLTYAANWDNYMFVNFWYKLDYIGIDAYFPLTDEMSPSVEVLNELWTQPKSDLLLTSITHGKKILFTEFGYRSIDGAMGRQWLLPGPTKGDEPNFEAQINGYASIFESFWQEPWFAGGFLWNWFAEHESAGGMQDNDYTPQNKPMEDKLRLWFQEYQR